jgi:solute carrier family 35 protein E1
MDPRFGVVLTLFVVHALPASAEIEPPRLATIALRTRRPPIQPHGPHGPTGAAEDADVDEDTGYVPLGPASATNPPHFRPPVERMAPKGSLRGRVVKLARVGMLLAAWYACNFAYSITNKAALVLWPFPFTFGAIQLLVGVVYVLLLWSPLPAYSWQDRTWRASSVRSLPSFTREHIAELLPAGLLLAIGHTAATAAPAYGSVAFTNVVKTTETLFASLCLALVVREFFPLSVYATLIPVVVGVALATVNELEFSWFTLGACGVSMNAFALYSIVAKRLMARSPYKEHGAASLYSALTFISFALLVPASLLLEGRQIRNWLADAASAAADRADGSGAVSPRLMRLLVMTGLFNYLSNELAFCVLDLCSPLTYAVANTIKRVIVIVGSVLTFHTPVKPLGALGAGMAIAGAFLYSLALNAEHNKQRRAALLAHGQAHTHRH